MTHDLSSGSLCAKRVLALIVRRGRRKWVAGFHQDAIFCCMVKHDSKPYSKHFSKPKVGEPGTRSSWCWTGTFSWLIPWFFGRGALANFGSIRTCRMIRAWCCTTFLESTTKISPGDCKTTKIPVFDHIDVFQESQLKQRYSVRWNPILYMLSFYHMQTRCYKNNCNVSK